MAAYGVLAALALQHGQAFAEEVASLIRSAWYVRHQVVPYTATDATGAMPLYPYALGFWQQLTGLGDITGRALSVGLGVVAGILLFLICLRMTANSIAAAGAVLLFLATPTTAYAFATATPAALLATLHLAGLWLVVAHLGRPRLWASAALGLVCTAMYFTRTDAFLAVIVLVPIYIAGIGRKRAMHLGVVLVTIAVLTAMLLAAFPDKLAHDAARLPILAPWIDRFVAPNFAQIDQGTTGAIGFSLSRLHANELLYGFILPYAGTIVLALLLPWLAGTGLRVLWTATLYFLWLAVTHYVAGDGRIVTTDAPTFIGAGALAAGLALALLGRSARTRNLPAAPAIIAVAVAALAANMFLPALAKDHGYKLYPSIRMREPMPTPERDDTIALARWIASYTSAPEAILPIYSLGRVALPALPYAVFLADHTMPAQGLDLPGTHRAINPRLPAPRREAVQAAIEDESLWADDTVRRWIDRDYDVILYQDDRSVDLSALRDTITARFDVAASTTYRGQAIVLYKRKASQ
ncbi:MAG: hypothetical protein ACXWJM_17255 [Ramlibacter sp.]